MNTYVTSDLHLGHERAVELSKRPFTTVDEMDQIIIDQINGRVCEDDEIWILGDFTLKGKRQATEYRERIYCKTVHLLWGNHDNRKYGSLFTSTADYKELKVDGTRIVMCHYPIEDWRDMKEGSIHLHGHMHGDNGHAALRHIDRRFDVGIDPNDFAPCNLETLVSTLRCRFPLDPPPAESE